MTCTLCPLSKSCLSPVLRSPLTKTGGVLIVCDFPDSRTDFDGEAFSGPLGRLLHDLCKKANLTDYQTTYAVKCAPESNGLSLPLASINACRTHLASDIARVQPEIILTMGDVALRAITKKSGIKTHRGTELSTLLEFGTNARVICTYSVDFVARRSTIERTVISDIRRCVPNKDAIEIPWKIWEGETIEGDILSYDIESVDSDGNYTTYPTQIAIAGANGCFLALNEDIKSLSKQLVGRPVVGHNSLHFDDPMMRKFGFDVHSAHDTMYLAYFLDETQPKGLEALAVKYLGVPGWKEAFSAPLGSEEFKLYNARDTVYTHRLYDLFKEELQKDKRWFLIENLIYPVRNALDAMSERGVFIDETNVLRVKKIKEWQLNKAERKVKIEMRKCLDTFDPKKINPGSNTQIAMCLQYLGVSLPSTDKGQAKTSKDVLQDLTHIPLVRMLQTYRETKKTLSTYVKPYLLITETEDGRAHPEYKMVSVETGRTSAANPNVQNLDRRLKGFFGAAKGKVLVSIDYSAIELRVAAFLANELGIIARFRENAGWDPHRFFAAMFYGKLESEVTKKERQVAKSANFSQLYIGTGYTMHEYAKKMGIHIPISQAEDLHKKWHETFPGFGLYYATVREELLTTGMVRCPTGFIRHFGDPELIRDNYGNDFFGKLRQGVNVPVQNLACHIAFLAMRKLHSLNFPMVLFVHDSISFEFDNDEHLMTNIRKAEDIMTSYPIQCLRDEFGINFTIPLQVETEIKKNGNAAA